MKKITGVLKAKGFKDCNFEFYVDDNMTEKQIEMEVYQRAGFSLDWTEEDNKRWRKVSSETPYMSPSAICSDDVEIKFKDGHTSVGFISFDGRWFNHDCDEIKRPDCWRPLEDNN